MNDRIANLIYDLFTWFGRSGRIRFVVTGSVLILLIWPLMSWDVSSSLQNMISTFIGWCLMMQFIKRGHDFGAPAWVSLLVCFASICVVPAFFLAVMPGDDTHNKYGVRGV